MKYARPLPLLCAALAFSAFAFSEDPAFDSGSDGSDGALFIRGTFAPAEAFAAVYDPVRDEVIGFGGSGYRTSSTFDHTYRFDGQSWSRVRRESGPSGREYPNLAYDPVRQNILLFGGDGSEIDTWTWDGSNWSELSPALSPPNYYREYSAMAFHPPSGRMVLVLRAEFSSQELVTWTWDGANWIESAAVIPRNNQFAMEYDPVSQSLVLLMRVPGEPMETWTYDGSVWTLATGQPIPSDDVTYGDLVYDGRIDQLAFYGRNGGYGFDGTDWAPLPDIPAVFQEIPGQIVYLENDNALLRINGHIPREGGGSRETNTTWIWRADGSLEQLTEPDHVFDMSERPSGVWQFTDITIGPNVNVTFTRNETNTPVRWLASGDALIEGSLDLSGRERIDEDSYGHTRGLGGLSGPGGFDGASTAPLGTDLKVPGNGPGGGLFGEGFGDPEDGEFQSYGNAWLHPLVGGSGGGSLYTSAGGAAGGAILIAASGEITLNGSIAAYPDRQGNLSGASYGSGGAVLLRATRASGTGSVFVDTGRIRVEAWQRPLMETGNLTNFSFRNTTDGPPLLPVDLDLDRPRLWIDSIAGSPVASPPLSHDSLVDPDAIVSNVGSASTVVVKGENVPAGAEVAIRVSLDDGSLLEPDPATYDGTQATFSVNLPEGFGAISATASFPNQD